MEAAIAMIEFSVVSSRSSNDGTASQRKVVSDNLHLCGCCGFVMTLPVILRIYMFDFVLAAAVAVFVVTATDILAMLLVL